MISGMIHLIIEAALRSAAMAAIVGLSLALLRVRNVPARKAAWSLVLIASLAMPLLMRWPAEWADRFALVVPIPQAQSSVPLSRMEDASVNLVRQPLRSEAGAAAHDPHPAAGKRIAITAAIDEEPVLRETFADANPKALHWPPPERLAIWTYAAVGGVLLLRLLYGLLAAVRLWATAELVSPLVAPEGYVRASSRIASPVTIGSGVVLPAGYPQWSRSKLRMVLAHELSHVRQMDFYLQLLAGLYTAVFWFSPLGWLLRRELASLGEAVADRAGIDAGVSRSDYAEVVLEFAALPRTNLQGVAMACSGNLSRRIDSMLNEHLFRNAFGEGRRRAAVALLLIPAAVFAVTALVRVPTASAQSANTRVTSTPDTQPDPEGRVTPLPYLQAISPKGAVAEPSSIAPAPASQAAEAAPQAAPAPASAPAAAENPAPAAAPDVPVPPDPPAETEGQGNDVSGDNTLTISRGQDGEGTAFHFSNDGESWALVRGPGSSVTFSGDWNDRRSAEIDAARRTAHGPFLWFTHDGKSYIVDDPAVVARIEAMYKPMEALGQQQAVLGKQQQALGRQMEALAEAQKGAVKVRLPDFSREMADLTAAMAKFKAEEATWNTAELADLQAKLKAQQGQMLSPEKLAQIQANVAAAQAELTSEKLAEIQAKMGELQGKLGELQGEAGARQGDFGEKMGALGEQQGKLGEQQGKLGEEQGRLAEEGNREVQNIIHEALRNGKAKPAQ